MTVWSKAGFGTDARHVTGADCATTTFSGEGVAFIACLGAVHCMQLQPGEEYMIDREHLLAWSATMASKLDTIGSHKTSMVSDEGSVCRFTGPGTVYVQTRNSHALAAYMRSIGVGKP